ncbi:MAG: cytochrome c3 family protein [Desulfurivibrionaceae bacterium]|nr:cytochrome c3 family protein [Desulfurivibrionaceae bacterium]
MTKGKIGLVMTAAFLVSAPWGMAGAQGPETIDLKEQFQVEGGMKAVIFPHRTHQAKLACSSCHLDPEGGGKLVVELVNKVGIGNDFHKKFCWPCHEEMKVPRGKSCTTCHG